MQSKAIVRKLHSGPGHGFSSWKKKKIEKKIWPKCRMSKLRKSICWNLWLKANAFNLETIFLSALFSSSRFPPVSSPHGKPGRYPHSQPPTTGSWTPNGHHAAPGRDCGTSSCPLSSQQQLMQTWALEQNPNAVWVNCCMIFRYSPFTAERCGHLI